MVDFIKKLFGSKEDFEKINGDNPMTFSHFRYRYADRKVPYMTESLEISKSEENDILSLLSSSQKNYLSSNEESKQFLPEKLQKYPKKIIIDTDLGTDADDVLAILMTLHLDESDSILLGITTNYHPTLLRKRIVEEILRKAGPPYDKIPVIAGPSALCGSHREYFHHGNEGLGLDLEKKELEELWKVNKSLDAPEFIYKACKENPGEITVISIGIPTNLGLCAYIHKDFQELVGHVVVMGGGSLLMKDKIGSIKGKPLFDLPAKTTQIFSFKGEQPEIPGFHLFPNHNISGDTLASKFLFSCKCPISLIPHSVTSRHWLEGLSIETLLSLKDSALSNEIPICGKLLFAWLKSRWGQRGQCPHDPLTVYEAIYSEDGDESFVFGKSCLMYMRGTFIVHEWAGYMTFIGDPKGPHRMAFSPKEAKKWVKWLDGKLIKNVPKDMLCVKWDGDLSWGK